MANSTNTVSSSVTSPKPVTSSNSSPQPSSNPLFDGLVRKSSVFYPALKLISSFHEDSVPGNRHYESSDEERLAELNSQSEDDSLSSFTDWASKPYANDSELALAMGLEPEPYLSKETSQFFSRNSDSPAFSQYSNSVSSLTDDSCNPVSSSAGPSVPPEKSDGVASGVAGTALAALFGGLKGVGDGLSKFRYSPVLSNPHISGVGFRATPYQFQASQQVVLPYMNVAKKG